MGFSSVSLAGLAKECGLAKSSLYSHFSSKEQIFDSIFALYQEKTHRPKGDQSFARMVDQGVFKVGDVESAAIAYAYAIRGFLSEYDMLRARGELTGETELNIERFIRFFIAGLVK